MGRNEMESTRRLLFVFFGFMIFCMILPDGVSAFMVRNDSVQTGMSDVAGTSGDTVLKSSGIPARDIYLSSTGSTSSHAGIALTFDDNYVDQWYAIRSIFQQYNAHATFFVSNFYELDQVQINKLKVLQADGHEIAFHGNNHEDVGLYLQDHSLNDYMNNEIIRGINLMKSNGFNPVDFAYPYGSDDPQATEAMRPYFLHIRDTYYDWDDTVYYTYGSNSPYIAGIGIDDNTYGNTLTDIYTGISKAKQDDRILIFYCHKPVESNPGEYETSYNRLEKILHYVSDNEMKTYTIKELDSAWAVPVAAFLSTPASGTAPLAVTFTDTSTNTPTSWNWSFRNVTGNNTVVWFSTSADPTLTFGAGNYSIVLNAGNSAGYDLSDQVTFINVNPAASITVKSPDGGGMLQRGTSYNVTWSFTGSPGSYVKIVLVKGGIEVGTVSASAPIGSGGTGSYTWAINPTGSTGSDYKVKVQSISQPAVSDTSNNNFSVTPAATTPSVTVTSPDGGEIRQRGTSHTITWDYAGNPGSTVKIMLVKGAAEVGTINASTPIGNSGKGSYAWQISSDGLTGSDFKVSVLANSQSTIRDVSNNYFTITQAGTIGSPSPSVTVTSPDGGEIKQRGTSHTITWDYAGNPGPTVKIMLVKGTAEVGTINASTSIGNSGKGSYTWQISSDGLTGSDFKVSVRSISQPAIKDLSNSFFTLAKAGITTPVPTPTPLSTSTITVISPNGTESWKRGTSKTITWSYTGSPGSTVKIMLVKGYLEVGTITSSTPVGRNGTGSYTWPINPSGSTGSDYKVSVQSISQPAIKDMSNNYFTLTV